MMRFSVSLMIIITLLFVMNVPGFGQINWMSPLHKPGISVKATKVDFPSLNYLLDYKFPSIVYDLSARVKLINGLYLLCEIPFVHSSERIGWYYDGYYYGSIFNKSSWGNPLIGLELNEGDNGFLIRLSTRLSTEEENDYYTYQYGSLSSRDRWEAFYPYSTTYYLHVGYNYSLPNHLRTQILLGSMLFKPESGDHDFYESLSGELWGDWRYFSLGLGYHIQYLLTGKGHYPLGPYENSFNRRMEHQIGLYGALSIGRIHPGIHLRIPLDESLREIVNFSYGLNLTVDLPQ